jgi:hypothetical protein
MYEVRGIMATGRGVSISKCIGRADRAHGPNAPGSCNLDVSTATASDSRVSTLRVPRTPRVRRDGAFRQWRVRARRGACGSATSPP